MNGDNAQKMQHKYACKKKNATFSMTGSPIRTNCGAIQQSHTAHAMLCSVFNICAYAPCGAPACSMGLLGSAKAKPLVQT